MKKSAGSLVSRMMLILTVVVITGAGCSLFQNNTMESTTPPTDIMMQSPGETPENENTMMEKTDVENTDSMMKDSPDESMQSGEAMMEKTTGSYETYESSKLARAETGDVVLFFHAPWCPTCRALNADIEENRTSIPDGVTILQTDYDTNTDLKKKYGVTYQHTLVQVDAAGNMIKKWSGGNTLSSVLSMIQ